MKPELIKHLTDTELMYCDLNGCDDNATSALVKAWKKEYENRNRLPNFSQTYCMNKEVMALRWSY